MKTARLPQEIENFIEYRTGDAVFVVAPDYRVVYWDSQAEFLTGLRSEDVLGRHCYEVVVGERENGESFCGWGCSVMRMSQEGRPVASYDLRVASPGGKKRWVNVSTLSVGCDDGTYVVHLLRDAQGTHEALEMARNLVRLSEKPAPGKPVAGRPAPAGRDAPALTGRQLEMLRLLSEGKSVKEIKGELHLSEATVRNHIRALLQALGAHSQLEALARARNLGLLNP
jgi:PAS domain S-box-containing protein